MPVPHLPKGVVDTLRGPGPLALNAATTWLREHTTTRAVGGGFVNDLLTELVKLTDDPHPARRAAITGRYEESSQWVGWIEDAARTWVAFVAKSPERFTLLWKEREVGGGVNGDPVCFLRDEDAERYHDTLGTMYNEPPCRTAEPGVVVKTVQAHGATFHVDRAIGSKKKGKGFDGKPFELTYTCDYGYLAKTHEDKDAPIGGDGMLIDAYCCAPTSRAEGDDGPPSSVGGEPMIHVVNQIHWKTKAHDEQKLILNAKDASHASRVYFDHTPSRCFASMFTMTGESFRAQLAKSAPGKLLTFVPSLPTAPEEPPPSTKRGAGAAPAVRGAIHTHAASATVHASQEPHVMPRTPVVVAAPGPDHAHALQRDAAALGSNDDSAADLFTRVITADRAYHREIDGKKRVCVDFVMSTEAKDSHGTILRAKWNLKRFNTNPVFLYMHNRREDRPPIGVMENVRVDGKSLLGTAILSDVSEFDREIAEKYLQRIMRGGSVGFNPGTITVEIVDGEETVVFDDIELLEFSAACVPSNPETIAKLTEQRARCLEIGRAASVDPCPIARGAVPHRKYPLDQSPKWDEKAAEKAVRAWATVGGKLNLGRYAQAFGHVDPEKSDTTAGYSLLHHSVSPDGKGLVTVRGGVVACASAIARNAVKLPPADMVAVKAHLAEHCKEFNIAPPWEKKKTHDSSTTSPETPMHIIPIRLLDTAPDANASHEAKSRAHGVQPCEVTCPGCSETLRVVSELPESVVVQARALTETSTLLKAEQARSTSLETKLTVRSADVGKLLVDLATRDLTDLTGSKIDPTEVETELELARVYFADETRDDKGNLVGLAKWTARVAKLKARPDQKLGERTIPAAKPGDAPTKPTEDAAPTVDALGRTIAGESALDRIRSRAS